MTQGTKNAWETMRDPDSRQVEEILRTEFPITDAYRFNSASIRVRVIDPRFAGKSTEERDAMVEPLLETLPETIQADIMNLLTLTPEEATAEAPLTKRLANLEFEDPSRSLL